MEALPGTLHAGAGRDVAGHYRRHRAGGAGGDKEGTFWDTSSIFVSVLGISAPSFFMGIVIAYLFGFVFSTMTGSAYDGKPVRQPIPLPDRSCNCAT